MMATMKLGSKQEAFQLEGNTWICKTELASDVVIQVGETSFHLHKFPLLNRSGLMQRMISEFHEEGKGCVLQIHDIPGGAKTFELVVKFCYDVRIEVNSLNLVPLRCAAEHLHMTEDYGEGNLIMQTEAFFEEVLDNWNDSMRALHTCKDTPHLAEELYIVSRCIDSLATKACADPTLFGWPTIGQTHTKNLAGTVLWNGIGMSIKAPGADWWYKDASLLDLPTYKRLILAVISKGMKPDNIAGSLMYYARRYLPGLTRYSSFSESADHVVSSSSNSIQSESDQRNLLEEIVELLPMEKGATSTKFLLGLLRAAMILHVNSSCKESLEKRVGAQLEDATLEDLLMPNMGYSVETLYDIDCIQRMLENFIVASQPTAATSPGIVEEGQLMASTFSLTPITAVAKLVDGYLAEVASDVNLKVPKFQSLSAPIPDYARQSADGIYRAIDLYLKCHPWLTDSEREQLCRLMNCQKLSIEACTHAAQNERLPLRVIIQVLFFEQLRLRTTIAGSFFVSNDMDNSSSCRMLPKNNKRHIQSEMSQQDDQDLTVEDMRMRVSELEKELSEMREEMQKIGRSSKRAWNFFNRKFGSGFRSRRFSSSSQVPNDK